MSEVYPPVAFYFQLSFSGVTGKSDASFKEVSGIALERGIEEITEGGNPYIHRVPTQVKYTNLVLKRGLVAKDSAVAKWCLDPTGGLSLGPISLTETMTTKTIVVKLLNEQGTPLKSWSFANAWPVKWSISDFNSMNNEIAIESMEFAYSYFKVL
ncbi:MAG: phage tail protein [Crocinitomicaceae bacterium]|nr:phage tail protein [Crocinitomicaceae bacterium]|tara:strand:+ start:6645 stop:7109 length:465 start_codon:yes stop_codon:yes gene_type:complete